MQFRRIAVVVVKIKLLLYCVGCDGYHPVVSHDSFIRWMKHFKMDETFQDRQMLHPSNKRIMRNNWMIAMIAFKTDTL